MTTHITSQWQSIQLHYQGISSGYNPFPGKEDLTLFDYFINPFSLGGVVLVSSFTKSRDISTLGAGGAAVGRAAVLKKVANVQLIINAAARLRVAAGTLPGLRGDTNSRDSATGTVHNLSAPRHRYGDVMHFPGAGAGTG